MTNQVDIVIPVGRNSSTLSTCLANLDEAIAGAHLPWARVLLVGDESPLDVSSYPHLRCEWLACPGSVSDRRNEGVARATSRLVLFLDSDVNLVPDGLEALVTAMDDGQHPLSAGATPLTPRTTSWGRAMAKMPFASAMEFANLHGELPWTPTTALLADRAALPDKPFVSLAPPRDCAEDVILGTSLTIKREGRPAVATVGRVVAKHDARAWDEKSEALERAWRFGKGEAAALTQLPENSMPAVTVLPWVMWLIAAAIIPWGWLAVIAALALIVGRWFRRGGTLRRSEMSIRARYFTSTWWHLMRSPYRNRRFIYHPGQVLAVADALALRSWLWLLGWVVLTAIGAVTL